MNNHKFRYRIATLSSPRWCSPDGRMQRRRQSTSRQTRLITDQLVPRIDLLPRPPRAADHSGQGILEEMRSRTGRHRHGCGERIPLTLKAVDHAYVTFAVPQDIPTGSSPPPRRACCRNRESQSAGHHHSTTVSTSEIPDKESMNVRAWSSAARCPSRAWSSPTRRVVTATDDTVTLLPRLRKAYTTASASS